MAFPASNGVKSDAVETVCRTATQMQSQAQAFRNRLAATNVPASEVLQLVPQLSHYRAAFSSASSVPGLGPYAQEQLGSPELDVAAEFQSMIAAIDGVINWVKNNFPKDVNGYVLARTWGATDLIDRNFTPAQTAGLRTALDSLIATVS